MTEVLVKIKKAFNINNIKLSEHQLNQLTMYIDLLTFWNKKINLTAHNTLDDIIQKDIIDSAFFSMYIIKYITKKSSCIDMGSGAGFCGTVLGILNSTTRIGMLESNRKKINFSKEVFRKLQLSGEFINERAESFPRNWRQQFDISVSRATWELSDYIEYANYYVQNNGFIISMLGPNQKIDLPENQSYQGLGRISTYDYTIKPKNLDRKIIAIKKKGEEFHVEQNN